jgi:hypothetical protein
LNEDDPETRSLYKNFAKDPLGCIFLQKRIDQNPSLCDKIFVPIFLPYFLGISNDISGNYLVQKIIYHANKENFKIIVNLVS